MISNIFMVINQLSIAVLIYTIIYCFCLLLAAISGVIVSYRNIYFRELALKMGINKQLPPVSIVAPAFNEEVCIVDCINNMLNIDYPQYEIIIVDDGSTDQTAQLVIDNFHLQPTTIPVRWSVPCQHAEKIYIGQKNGIDIILACKPNGKKADASNCGINIAKYPYILDTDIDSILQQDCIRLLMEEFLIDDEVIAVGGRIGICNELSFENNKPKAQKLPKNWLAALQVLEYDRSFLCSRAFFNAFNGNLIISGALGLFKKDMVLKVGGYRTDALGEDMDIATRLHQYCKKNKIPYKMKYVPEAICWTQCPSNLKDLRKQRQRWFVGLQQVMWRYKDMISFPYLYYLFFEFLAPFIEMFGWLVIILALILQVGTITMLWPLFVICAVFGMFSTMASFTTRVLLNDKSITFKEILKGFGLCFVDLLIWKPYHAIIRIAALFKPKKKKYAWDALKREKIDFS